MMPDTEAHRLTRAYIHLERLAHNLRLLQEQAGAVPLWPVIKANAYGHGAALVARHLATLGYRTLGVADVAEAVQLVDQGIDATFIVLSATLPEHSEALVAYGCEPVVCTREMVDALARADLSGREIKQAAIVAVSEAGAREPLRLTAADAELGIRTASQGLFTIQDRDSNTPHIKKVRVVSTVEYYLSD